MLVVGAEKRVPGRAEKQPIAPSCGPLSWAAAAVMRRVAVKMEDFMIICASAIVACSAADGSTTNSVKNEGRKDGGEGGRRNGAGSEGEDEQLCSRVVAIVAP